MLVFHINYSEKRNGGDQMSEVLRDFVVSLSLEDDNFSQNFTSI